jgi:glyoxylase-like metal-dependent hydrolase (beta-lactamase superfamily II)
MAGPERAAAGVYKLRTLMANMYFVAADAQRGAPWVLIDTGIRGYAGSIRRAAAELFDRAPSAILLTHGHFDHVGGLPRLADEWQVPVYAHPLERPYLNGRSPFPPPDPSAGGGLFAETAALYPRGPIDLGSRLHLLPSDGSVPLLPGWRWIHTPGHTCGHVSFFRDADRTLIAGDAVVATRQESMWWVITQGEIVWRPPAYYTSDWNAARRSIQTLAALEPDVLATGHGHVLAGPSMRAALHALADNFDAVMPSIGRYVPYPAIADESGVVHVPPRAPITPAARAAIAAAAVAGAALILNSRRRA